jgi:PadR family transcriptional regulator, regulatory protein PadR
MQVALALMQDADARHWGYDLSKQSGVRSGVMYPLLGRMLDEGWLDDGWEEQSQVGRSKRPPRRYYELTDAGRVALGAVLADARQDARFKLLLTPKIAGGQAG